MTHNKQVDTTFFILLTIIVVGVFGMMFIAIMKERGDTVQRARVDIPEAECELPIYTAHGDYALCMK